MSEDSFQRKRPILNHDFISVEAAGELLQLSPQRFIYWPKENTIFLADCHFGKVSHFRKSGISIPQEAGNQTFTEIHQILNSIRPDRVIFLGDLFHSHYNLDFDRFRIWRKQFENIHFELVLGNHDVELPSLFKNLGLTVIETLQAGPFFCTHHPDFEQTTGFNLSGHIHPAVHIYGLGRQSLTLPCFWKGNQFIVLPAFGSFTGFLAIRPAAEDQIFAVAGSRLKELSGKLIV